MAISRWKFEREFVGRGLERIAGADEAGRGPLAGPVVAAVAILPVAWIRGGLPTKLRGLNDSKQLTEEERGRFFDFLSNCGQVAFAVAIVTVEVIDAINILQASLRAMNEALDQLNPTPEHTLVDGPHISSLRHPQTPLIDGDAKSYTIAAASVLAKVTRDRLMCEYHSQFPEYGFNENKGYGTPKHLEALGRLGPCALHRRSFAPVRQQDPTLFDC